MAQKLSLSANMLAMDSAVNGTAQMKLLAEMLLEVLKN